MKKFTLCLLIIVALILLPGAIFAAENNEPKVYSTKGTYTLNLEGEFTASGYDAAIYVHSGAKLTINGEGKVHAYADNGGSGDKYATAVWAYGEGSEIEINGGTYTNQDVGDDHVDLIYAKAEGKIVINGGTFNCATPKWTLNLHDSLRGEIIVKGGTFYKFNPADAQTEPGEEHFNYVAPGYRVVQDGDWYTVCKEHTITVKEVEGGKIIVREVSTSNTVKEIDKAISGETVEVVVEQAEGYKFKEISGVDGLKDVAEYAYQFKMPNKDVVLTPVFEKLTTEAEVPSNVANTEKVETMVIETLKELVEKDPTLAEKIEGKNIEVEVQVKPVDVNKEEKETIEKEAAKEVEGIKIGEYIDITISVKDADTDKEITTLSTVKEAIKFTVEVPEKFKTGIPDGHTRKFYIIRNHDGMIDVWETEEVDGKLSFKSDKFSTYAIAYKDVKNETTVTPPASNEETTGEGGTGVVEPEAKPETDNKKEEIPDPVPTGDNVLIFAGLAIVSIVGLGIVTKKYLVKE